jgi:hypothetical protein
MNPRLVDGILPFPHHDNSGYLSDLLAPLEEFKVTIIVGTLRLRDMGTAVMERVDSL